MAHQSLNFGAGNRGNYSKLKGLNHGAIKNEEY